MAIHKILNCVWFDHGEAHKSAEFYAGLFPDSHVGTALGGARRLSRRRARR